MTTGMILEGGGLKCLFTAGILDVLLENNIRIDTAIGVSAGAAFGCNFKSKQPKRVLNYNLRFSKDPRYFGIKSLLKTGNLFEEDFCYRQIPDEFFPFDYKTYSENPTKFYAVATNIETGEPAYHLCETGNQKDLKWLQASASIPFVSQPVEIDNKKYLDGGIADPIPVGFAQELGIDKMLIVRPNTQNYLKKSQTGINLSKLFYNEYPKLFKSLKNHHLVYNQEVKEIEKLKREGKALVLAPEIEIKAGVTERNSKKLLEAYNYGRETALFHLDEIKEFLNKE